MSPTLSFFAPHAAPDDAEDPPRDTGEIHCTLSWHEESHHILLTGIINIYFFCPKHGPSLKQYETTSKTVWTPLLTANLSLADYGSRALETLARRHGVEGNPVEEGYVALVAGIIYLMES
jgi:hypothetical protein